MNMIKKIALTASMLLFVLTQIFSFYVIFTGHKEKIELLREKELLCKRGAVFYRFREAIFRRVKKAGGKNLRTRICHYALFSQIRVKCRFVQRDERTV